MRKLLLYPRITGTTQRRDLLVGTASSIDITVDIDQVVQMTYL